MRLFNIKAFLILAIIIVKIVYLDFLISCINRVALIIQIFIKRGAGCPLVTFFNYL